MGPNRSQKKKTVHYPGRTLCGKVALLRDRYELAHIYSKLLLGRPPFSFSQITNTLVLSELQGVKWHPGCWSIFPRYNLQTLSSHFLLCMLLSVPWHSCSSSICSLGTSGSDVLLDLAKNNYS